MHPLSIFLLAVAMSTDAFAAAVGKGAAMRAPRFRDALRAGAIFGVIEGLMPLAGWVLGVAAARHVAAWDHWLAFTLLVMLGLRMIRAGMRGEDVAAVAGAPRRHGFLALSATGFATSIDAMAVGVGLAFLDVDIVVVAVVIGLTTLVMVTLGILLGRMLGAFAGKRAEVAGGVLLIVIGAMILHDHLGGTAMTATVDVRILRFRPAAPQHGANGATPANMFPRHRRHARRLAAPSR